MQARVNSNILPGKSRGFDSILLEAVDTALVNTMGSSGATVVKFYIDTSAITKDPELFQESLRRLFMGSDMAPKYLEDKIQNFLVDLLQREHSLIIPSGQWKEKNFRQFILACKRHFEVSKNPP